MTQVLVQTLVVRGNEVLLGRWRPGSGAFAGRLTGLLGSATSKPGQAPPKPEEVAAAVCTELLGSGVQVDPRRLRRRALFEFEERDASGSAAKQLGSRYVEHEFIYRLRAEEGRGGADPFEPEDTAAFQPFGWFGPNDMPFHMMPEDDELWYDDVLYGNKLMKGTFAFEGDKLVEHSLQEVAPAEGLCDLDKVADGKTPLLLHNGKCSKSRALRSALEERGVPFNERAYLEDPLSLSELETLLARLRAGATGGGFEVAGLCRDKGLVEEIRLSNMFRSGFFGGGAGGDAVTDEDLMEHVLEAIAVQPEIMERHVLIHGRRAALGRPKFEDALWLLSE